MYIEILIDDFRSENENDLSAVDALIWVLRGFNKGRRIF